MLSQQSNCKLAVCVTSTPVLYKYKMENAGSTMWSGDDLDNFASATIALGDWSKEMMEKVNCEYDSQVTVEKFKKLDKAVLMEHLFDVFQYISNYNDVFPTARFEIENMKSELIKSQKSVTQLQGELLEMKSKEHDSVQSTVKTAVENSVQDVIQSYSSVVSKYLLSSQSSVNVLSRQSSAPPFAKQKNGVVEGDRSRNVVIFGLAEDAEEDLNNKIGDVFKELNNPRFKAVRVGSKSADKARPVRVSLENSGTVHHILIRAKDLRLSQDYKTVVISPDFAGSVA